MNSEKIEPWNQEGHKAITEDMIPYHPELLMMFKKSNHTPAAFCKMKASDDGRDGDGKPLLPEPIIRIIHKSTLSPTGRPKRVLVLYKSSMTELWADYYHVDGMQKDGQ